MFYNFSATFYEYLFKEKKLSGICECGLSAAMYVWSVWWQVLSGCVGHILLLLIFLQLRLGVLWCWLLISFSAVSYNYLDRMAAIQKLQNLGIREMSQDCLLLYVMEKHISSPTNTLRIVRKMSEPVLPSQSAARLYTEMLLGSNQKVCDNWTLMRECDDRTVGIQARIISGTLCMQRYC
jgi:hypothetical protein